MTPVEQNDWARMADDAERKTRAAVVYAAANAQTQAKIRSRVDTGDMKRGWNVRDGGGEAGSISATIYNSQAYAIFHELEPGFHPWGRGRLVPAQPMLKPALDLVEPTFRLMLAEVLKP